MRAGLSGGRLGARRRRAEPAGLQSLRRHALLRSELSLQGASLQLLRLRRRRGIRQSRLRSLPRAEESGSHGARARRDGEMHLLRPAHQRRAPRRRTRRPPDRTDEVKTACQSACPTSAISFGDLQSEGFGGQPPEGRSAPLCAARSISGRARAPPISPTSAIPRRASTRAEHERRARTKPAASASLDCRRARQRCRDHAGHCRAAVRSRPARPGGSRCS